MEEKIYEMLGQHDGYYTRPPLDHRKMFTDEGEVISLNNDGGEVWIGTMDKWYWHTKNEKFRKICFWYLRQWAFVDWFGLRSWLWYKLLSRQCAKYKEPK